VEDARDRRAAYEAANNLGIVRVAIEVDDLDAAHAKLREAIGPALSGIGTWDMGEFGTHRVAIFTDPDSSTLELIEQPETARQPHAGRLRVTPCRAP
jgi:catechol 2,3-dioxygenase-like lactoylglutathione lyase family enzyme